MINNPIKFLGIQKTGLSPYKYSMSFIIYSHNRTHSYTDI